MAGEHRLGSLVPDWAPPPRPEYRSLEGRHVRVEPLTEAHSIALHAAYADAPETWDYMPYGPFPSAAVYADWVRGMAGRDDPMFFALIDRSVNLAAGVASFLRIAPDAGSIEVGHIALSPSIQRTPAATEAIYLMMRWAFGAGYRRFEWKCNALNRASRRAAQRYGLSFEGVFRNAAVIKGRNRDTAWFAATDGDWPALQAAFETWLDPANFDSQGVQKARLSDLTLGVLVNRDPVA